MLRVTHRLDAVAPERVRQEDTNRSGRRSSSTGFARAMTPDFFASMMSDKVPRTGSFNDRASFRQLPCCDVIDDQHQVLVMSGLTDCEDGRFPSAKFPRSN